MFYIVYLLVLFGIYLLSLPIEICFGRWEFFKLIVSFYLEKEMATHPSILTWKIQWTEEPGRLHSTGLQRVGHDWAKSQFVYQYACILSHVWLFETPWTVACQSSVHAIFQARILEWVAIFYSRDWTCISCVSCIGRHSLLPHHLGSTYRYNIKTIKQHLT